MESEKITALNKQLRRSLLNQEILSLTYENVIGVVKGYKIVDAGIIIDTLNTNEKIESLWNEYAEQEGLN
jgi:hypothetical protein